MIFQRGLTACLLAGAWLSVIATDLAAQANSTIPQYGIFEASFEHLGEFDNPYRQMAGEATFTRPNDPVWTIPIFWDGGKTWKVRISPDQVGTWRYVITANEQGLDGQAGTFNVIPSDLHGGIQPMADHPYHFQHQDGTPFWFFGDTGWSLFSRDNNERNNRRSVRHYIDVRASQGFNYIHTMLVGSSKSYGRNEGGELFVNVSFAGLNPAYLQEVESTIAYMNARGITCGVVLGWGNGLPSWRSFGSPADMIKFAHEMVARLSAYNVVFILSGEVGYLLPRMRGRLSDLGRGVAATDPHDRLITFHAGPGAYTSVKTWAEGYAWHGFGDYQQAYFAPRNRESTDAERDELRSFLLASRTLDRPVVNGEYAYYLRDQDSDGKVDKSNSHTRTSFRRASWALAMAGGYFVTGFGTTYLGGERDPGHFNVDNPKNDDAETDLMRIQRFFSELAWWLLEPADELVSGGGYQYCLANPGQTYVVWTTGTRTATLRVVDSTEGYYRVDRTNPRTGETRRIIDPAVGDTLELYAPDDEDWVYLVQLRPL